MSRGAIMCETTTGKMSLNPGLLLLFRSTNVKIISNWGLLKTHIYSFI
jgi:hypothetical protein